MADPAWLPPLRLMDHYGGDWHRYLEAVYAVFCRDFIEEQARFRGDPVRVGAQLIRGKERTFWHLIQEGAVKEDRTPDFRRCERIGWVRAMVDHENEAAVLSWPQTRGRNQRQVLWVRDSGFAVVLEKRPACWWLWTAHPTDRPHTQRTLMREYEAWKIANAAP